MSVLQISGVLEVSTDSLRLYGGDVPSLFGMWVRDVGKIEPTSEIVAELSAAYPNIGTEHAETLRLLTEYSKFGADREANRRVDVWLAVLTGLVDSRTWLDRDPIKVKDGWLSTSTCAIRVRDIVLTQIMPSRTVIRIDYARSGTSIARFMETTFESAKYARDAHDKLVADLRVAWIELSSENE